MRKVRLLLVSALVMPLSLVAPGAASAAMTAPPDCGLRVDPAATAAAATTTVWMAGDSTMANPKSTCPVGWATEFDGQFHSNVVVNNLAVSGRSIQTWLYEGGVTANKNTAGECVLSSTTPSTNWQKTLDGMKAGDYLFIQFGINDGDSACPKHVGGARYRQLMTMMAQTAQARGAFPVLVTPVAAIACSGSTATLNRGFYPETFAAGTATGAPVIDLRTLSVNYYNSLGLCPNNGDYTAGLVGQFFCNDHTHFEAYGARRIMRLVTGALKTQNIALAGSLL
ncbi:carbohydrate esterase [Actinoplanes sp. NPDC049599]|uniref:carbohydrate esterase n=1 Tax=Actinoplanes sp. NPDC049599 TaxID=3363903 RepID=UPI00378C7D17